MLRAGATTGVMKINLIWIPVLTTDDESDIGIAIVALLLGDLVEVRLIRKIAHRLAGLDAVEELRIGRKLTGENATKQFSPNLSF